MHDKIHAALAEFIEHEGEATVASRIGVSQATVNRWKNQISRPRGLSARAVETVLKQEGLI